MGSGVLGAAGSASARKRSAGVAAVGNNTGSAAGEPGGLTVAEGDSEGSPGGKGDPEGPPRTALDSKGLGSGDAEGPTPPLAEGSARTEFTSDRLETAGDSLGFDGTAGEDETAGDAVTSGESPSVTDSDIDESDGEGEEEKVVENELPGTSVVTSAVELVTSVAALEEDANGVDASVVGAPTASGAAIVGSAGIRASRSPWWTTSVRQHTTTLSQPDLSANFFIPAQCVSPLFKLRRFVWLKSQSEFHEALVVSHGIEYHFCYANFRDVISLFRYVTHSFPQ